MVAKITTGKDVYGALAYNQQKVDRGKGKVLLTHILREPPDGRFDIATTAEDLLRWMPSHYRTEKPVVHISLNPDPEDRLVAEQLTEIAEKSVHKERIIGTHYWNPAYLIPLVEVIKTKYVSEDVVAETCRILEDAGKKPVIVQKDVPGFLANRMQHALFREAISIVENGIATAEDVDKAIKYGFGMRLGIRPPMEVIDAGGTDLTYSIHKYLFPHIENSTEPSPLLKQKLDEGKLGFKSGEGFMKWSKEDIEKSNKDMVEGLIKVAKALDRI